MADSSTSPLEPTLGEPRDFTLARDGDRDLAFKGWKISGERDCLNAGTARACTEVIIYASLGGRIVTHVRQWREREDSVDSERQRVGHHNTAEAALKWLKDDNGGVLGPLSKKVWLDACNRHPKLTGQGIERIG